MNGREKRVSTAFFFFFFFGGLFALSCTGGLRLIESHLDVLDEGFAGVGGASCDVGFELLGIGNAFANVLRQHFVFSALEVTR